MCGRYGRRTDKQRIAEWMQTHDTNVFDDSYFEPSYNVAPQSFQPVVRLDPETGNDAFLWMTVAWTVRAGAKTDQVSPLFWRKVWAEKL